MNQTRTIRLPIHVVKELNVYLRVARELAQKLDHEPTAEEIATHLGKPVKQVSAMLNLNDRVGSVDNCLGPDSDTTLLETIPDTATQGPENTLVDINLMTNMEQWLDLLTDLQKDVISRRFGLRGHSVCTLEHVGKDINLTRERVRQIQVGLCAACVRFLKRKALTAQMCWMLNFN